MMNLLKHYIGYCTSSTSTNSCSTMNENILISDKVLIDESVSLIKVLR